MISYTVINISCAILKIGTSSINNEKYIKKSLIDLFLALRNLKSLQLQGDNSDIYCDITFDTVVLFSNITMELFIALEQSFIHF